MHHPSITIFDTKVQSQINTDFEIKLLDSICEFSEGPVWNDEGFYLFSDIPANVIYKIAEGERKEVYINNSGCTLKDQSLLSDQPGSNGLTYDNDGNLLICQHGNGAVAKYDGKKVEQLVSEYNQRRFNSPNDIVVDKEGKIFFSDPPYGLKNTKLNKEYAQPTAAFYCLREGELILFSSEFHYPNGVCLSTDHKSVYCCSAKSSENRVLEYDADTLEFKRVVAEENSDGIKSDRYNNFFLSTNEGVLIIDRYGKRLALITLDTMPANLCWGGLKRNDLLITARENIYLIKDLQKV